MATKKEAILAKKGTTGMSTTTESPWGALAGDGYQGQSNADITIPFLTVVQKGSPAVEEDGVPGAKPGMFLNTLTGELYTEVLFIPCYTERMYVEWVPRDAGGGFVGTHMPDSDVVAAARASAEKFNKLKSGEGNELVETFYMYGLVISSLEAEAPTEMAVIAFTSTFIGVYKKANTAMRTVKGQPPLFAHRMKLTTKLRKSDQYSWHLPVIEPANGKSFESSCLPQPASPGDESTWHPLLLEGRSLKKMVMGGLARAAFETAGREDSAPAEPLPF